MKCKTSFYTPLPTVTIGVQEQGLLKIKVIFGCLSITYIARNSTRYRNSPSNGCDGDCRKKEQKLKSWVAEHPKYYFYHYKIIHSTLQAKQSFLSSISL